ncbi:protein kinase superfamily protein [Artemisia annua]|uniref:Protein kinase superfamily protein n=1 Tax=Artemisia annua TaxID=35608 RepID=A0A2U1M4B4_ARTAN|nr:protein kinase superfamily protein [Artemisia annua]
MESNLCLSSITLFSLLSLTSSQTQYVPDHYFINCGANSDIVFTTKRFVGDDKPSTFSVSGSHKAVQNNSSPTPIYQTARVFTKKTSYNLEADNTCTFVMVRLHFSPFSTNEFDLHNFIFDVEASGFKLLSNFKVENTPLVKDFIIPIENDRKFTIEFTPSRDSTSGFVNAIEAFTTPNDIFRHGVNDIFRHGVTLKRISPNGENGEMSDISTSYAFNPIYRINVGGWTINPERDPLRRSWTPDEPFLFSNVTAKNESQPGLKPSYDSKGATPYDAPVDVYSTARSLANQAVNMTWKFRVNKNTVFLIRAHFCDIMSTDRVNANDAFSLFIYSLYKKDIPLGQIANPAQVPFYADFVVDSGEFDNVSISFGAIRGDVFLNGVEIMELLKDGKKNEKKVHLVIGCVVGGVVLVLVLGFLIRSKYWKSKPVVGAKRESNMVSSYGRSLSISIDFTKNHSSPIPNLNLNLKFQLADILQATNNFDEKLMIGKGGFGRVYKGTLSDGMIVAVKRGEKGHGQGKPEFVTEIMVLSKIRHRHLVSLIGYCDEKSEMILVYEFMKKGTLQDHLYDTNENLPKLSWTQRLEICISASRGLDYLHTGSFGYLDPEYITCMEVTPKIDVYSFGVVLLEILCARRALDNRLPYEEANLADWATTRIRNGEVENIIDTFLAGKINPNSLTKFLEIVERCLKPTGDERPSMNSVLYDLVYTMELQQTMANREPHEDSTMNTSFELSMIKIDRLPSHTNDDSEVNESSDSSFPTESQVIIVIFLRKDAEGKDEEEEEELAEDCDDRIQKAKTRK